MVKLVFGILSAILRLLDLALVTLLLYSLAWLPRRWLGSWYHNLFRWWCRTFVHAFGVDLKLHQKNTKPLPKQCIYISNHPSAFEDIGMLALFDCTYLAKKEVQYWWITGRISTAGGTLYFNRENKDSRQQAKAALLGLLRQGKSVALYPEGGCKGRRIHLPFQHGAFDISKQTGVPIVPVFLHYEAQEDFEWRDDETLLQKMVGMLFAKNKTVNYYLYDAVYPDHFSDKADMCRRMEQFYLQSQEKYLE